MILFQAMHFGEPFICEKAEFFESAHIPICLHSVNPCLIYRRKLRFLKNHRNGSSRSLYKIEEGEVIHIAEVVYRTWEREGGGKHCFSLVTNGLCNNNALYSASLSFMFILFLTPFDTTNCYYFKSNLRLVLLIKTFLIKKHVTLFYNLLNVKKYLASLINSLD